MVIIVNFTSFFHLHVLKRRIQRNLQNEKRVVFILTNFQNYRKLTNSLQPYFRVVLGLKRVDSNQPESGVFSLKLQFQSIWVDPNQPGLEAV